MREKNFKNKNIENKENKENFELTWFTYLYYINLLINKIKKSKIRFNYVYGIPRGGIIPAIIISHELNLHFVNCIDCYDLKTKKILIVDDICDSGKTLSQWTNLDNITTATIFRHEKSPTVPDFYVKESSKWIVFPYEKGGK